MPAMFYSRVLHPYASQPVYLARLLNPALFLAVRTNNIQDAQRILATGGLTLARALDINSQSLLHQAVLKYSAKDHDATMAML